MAAQQRDSGEIGPGLLESLWRYRTVVALVAVLTAGAAAGLSLLQPQRFEATARLFLAERGSAGVFDVAPSTVDPARYTQNQAQLVMSRPVARRAAELVDGRVSPRELQDAVVAEASPDFDLVTVRAHDTTAGGAAELADATAQAYQEIVAEDVRTAADEAIARLNETAATLEERIVAIEAEPSAGASGALAAERDAAVAQLASIERRVNQLSIDAGLFGSGVRLSEEAAVPLAPVQPRPVRNGALGFVLGALAASGFAYWRADHARRADDRHDPAGILHAPLLGEIPDFDTVGAAAPVPARDTPQSVAVEAYELVVSSLELALGSSHERDGSTILLTSAQAGEGKTTTALNLALAARQDNRTVLLVDGDERVRGLSALAGLEDREGFTDLGELAVPSHWCRTDWALGGALSIGVVPAGRPSDGSSPFFRSTRFRTAMKRIRSMADVVLIDSPPLLEVSDTSALASRVDGIVLVVGRGTPLRQLEEVRRRLAFVGTPLVGYVFNRSTAPRGRYGARRYGYREDGSAASREGDERNPAVGSP